MRVTMGFAKKISLFEGDTFTVKYQPKVLTVQASPLADTGSPDIELGHRRFLTVSFNLTPIHFDHARLEK